MTVFGPETTLTEDQRSRVKDVVCDVLDIDPAEITLTGSFTEDNGADSMSLVALGASLERVFDIEIEDEKVDQMKNLEGVIAIVGEALAEGR
jgi:acyl carrier protein